MYHRPSTSIPSPASVGELSIKKGTLQLDLNHEQIFIFCSKQPSWSRWVRCWGSNSNPRLSSLFCLNVSHLCLRDETVPLHLPSYWTPCASFIFSKLTIGHCIPHNYLHDRRHVRYWFPRWYMRVDESERKDGGPQKPVWSTSSETWLETWSELL